MKYIVYSCIGFCTFPVTSNPSVLTTPLQLYLTLNINASGNVYGEDTCPILFLIRLFSSMDSLPPCKWTRVTRDARFIAIDVCEKKIRSCLDPPLCRGTDTFGQNLLGEVPMSQWGRRSRLLMRAALIQHWHVKSGCHQLINSTLLAIEGSASHCLHE